MTAVQKLVTADSFYAHGVLVKAGHIATFDTETLNGDEKHIKDVDGFVPARIEMAAIAPTGPNPQNPQQIPPDAVQTAEGYVTPGKVLVGEVTNPQEMRLEALRDDSTEAKVDATLADVMGTAGDPDKQLRAEAAARPTVTEATADLGSKTDDELNKLEADENASEK